MTKYPFSKIADLWELFDYSDPITAYRDTFKDDLEFDIVELQTKYADEAKRIEDQILMMRVCMEGIILVLKKTPENMVRDQLKVYLPVQWASISSNNAQQMTES